jgi:hypothetical protein
MIDEIVTLDICNGAMQERIKNLEYLAEILRKSTMNGEPSGDDLRQCYIDAENIGDLILNCTAEMNDCLLKNEQIIEDMLSRKKK